MPEDAISPIGFNHMPLNRFSEQRGDTALIGAFEQAESTRWFLFSGDGPLLRRQGQTLSPAFSKAEAGRFGTPDMILFMGVDAAGVACFVSAFAPAHIEACLRDGDGGDDEVEKHELRQVAMAQSVDAAALGVLGSARALLNWHQRHGFCANCAQATSFVNYGWRRDCPGCAAQHFPRVDPVVIMLARSGDQCLLGRQPRFAPGMYSALAGFMEPGETIEAAVRREIHEEAGIRIADVRYFASQPWPFPSSLMMGCFAEATSREVTIDRNELEDARWFSRDEVRAMLDGTHPQGLNVPLSYAIAHHLIKAFASEDNTPVNA